MIYKYTLTKSTDWNFTQNPAGAAPATLSSQLTDKFLVYEIKFNVNWSQKISDHIVMGQVPTFYLEYPGDNINDFFTSRIIIRDYSAVWKNDGGTKKLYITFLWKSLTSGKNRINSDGQLIVVI